MSVVPPEERSHWGRKIALGEFVTSVEVLPPKGVDAKKTLDSQSPVLAETVYR